MGKKLTCIDLFAGCGGLSEGFMQTGCFDLLAHVEWELPMVKTLRRNLVERWKHSNEDAEKAVVHFDIQKIDELLHGNWSEESQKDFGKTNAPIVIEKGLDGVVNGQEVDIIIGGPPCQAYSIAGRAQDPNSMKNDYRNYLFESFVKVVDYFKPKAFVFENVPGMLSAKPGDRFVIDRIYDAFTEIGYKIRSPKEIKNAIYSAVDFGVPQDRHRVILFGVRDDNPNGLEEFYSNLNELRIGSENYKTVKDAIGDLPAFAPLKESYKQGSRNVSHCAVTVFDDPEHEARYHNPRDIEIFKEWIANDMNHASTEKKLEFYKNKTGKTSNHNKYRNLDWDKPSPTIVSHLYKDGLMFIHPDKEQARSITIREAALLQSFPKDFIFDGSTQYKFKMIGNAVPVLFAKNIAKAANKVVNAWNKKKVLNVLIACEESQRVCMEFRRLGHNAYSCDLLECSGGHPEWHFKHDVLEIIKNGGGILQNGEEAYIEGKWDLMIAHPPCTFLAVSGARWFYHPDDKDLPVEQRRPHPRFPNRAQDREDGANFFMALMNADIEHIAVENPVGIMSSRFRPGDQIVQPYFFGDSASKTTCLWLKNLKPLVPTNMVDKGEYVELSSGKRLPKWYSDALTQAKSAAERRTLRSKTFPGFAKAMAEQWSKELTE